MTTRREFLAGAGRILVALPAATVGHAAQTRAPAAGCEQVGVPFHFENGCLCLEARFAQAGDLDL